MSTRSTTRFSQASSIANHEAMKLGRNSQTLRRTGTKAFTTNASDSAPSTSNNQLMGASLPLPVPEPPPGGRRRAQRRRLTPTGPPARNRTNVTSLSRARHRRGVHDGAMGKRLTGLDAIFLYVETEAMPMHVALCAVLDPSTVPGGYTFEKMRAFLDSRVPLIKEFHRVVAEVPFRLNHPVWVDDPDYAVEHHVHRAVLDAPGDEHQLAAFVAEMAERRLDRSRPLWEFWVVEGLEGGRIALCGQGAPLRPRRWCGRRPHARLLRHRARSAARSSRTDTEPAPRPDDLELLSTAARRPGPRPRRLHRRARSPRPVGAHDRHPPLRDRRAPAAPRSACPTTPFNGAITSRRAISFGRLSLAEVKAVGRASGATVNDVLLATCAQAFRAYLLLVDALPDRAPGRRRARGGPRGAGPARDRATGSR